MRFGLRRFQRFALDENRHVMLHGADAVAGIEREDQRVAAVLNAVARPGEAACALLHDYLRDGLLAGIRFKQHLECAGLAGRKADDNAAPLDERVVGAVYAREHRVRAAHAQRRAERFAAGDGYAQRIFACGDRRFAGQHAVPGERVLARVQRIILIARRRDDSRCVDERQCRRRVL